MLDLVVVRESIAGHLWEDLTMQAAIGYLRAV
jgi:hypothetical protein